MSQSKFRETLQLLVLKLILYSILHLFEIQNSTLTLYFRPVIWRHFACVQIQQLKYTSGNKS